MIENRSVLLLGTVTAASLAGCSSPETRQAVAPVALRLPRSRLLAYDEILVVSERHRRPGKTRSVNRVYVKEQPGPAEGCTARSFHRVRLEGPVSPLSRQQVDLGPNVSAVGYVFDGRNRPLLKRLKFKDGSTRLPSPYFVLSPHSAISLGPLLPESPLREGMTWTQTLPVKLPASGPLPEVFPVSWRFHVRKVVRDGERVVAHIKYGIDGRFDVAEGTGDSRTVCTVRGKGRCSWDLARGCLLSKEESITIQRKATYGFGSIAGDKVSRTDFRLAVYLKSESERPIGERTMTLSE